MQENYKILTITHRLTDLKQIGQYVLKVSDDHQLRERLEAIKEEFELSELFYLATCNRVMFLFKTHQDLSADFAVCQSRTQC